MTEQECITLNMIMTAIVYDYGGWFLLIMKRQTGFIPKKVGLFYFLTAQSEK